jgi:hypothetical protein
VNSERGAVDTDQLLDGGEILTCTFATMHMLQRAVAAELGEDDAAAYGPAHRPDLQLISAAAEDGASTPRE